MVKLYCKILGADFQILSQSGPESRKKIVLLGNALLIPVILWIVTGYLLTHEVLKKSVSISLLSSLFCGALIFLVERQILMAHGNYLQKITRIILGLCMATVGSIALDEVIFEHDIDLQVQENKARYISRELDIFKSTLDQDLLKLTGSAESAREDWKRALQDATREADGNGGSGKKGVGTITQLKLSTAESLSDEYQIADGQLKKFNQEKDKALERKKDILNDAFNENSLLIRIKAMFDLVVQNRAMLIVYLLFSAILFIFEFIVIITKSATGITTYDRKMDLIEEIGRYKTAQLLETSRKAFDPGRQQSVLQNGYRIVENRYPSVFN